MRQLPSTRLLVAAARDARAMTVKLCWVGKREKRVPLVIESRGSLSVRLVTANGKLFDVLEKYSNEVQFCWVFLGFSCALCLVKTESDFFVPRFVPVRVVEFCF